MSTLEGITVLDHMTDAEYSVEATTLPHAFEQCGVALEHTMVDLASIGDSRIKYFRVSGHDLNELLYKFLEKLILLQDSEGMLFSLIVITDFKQHKDGCSLKAHMLGESYDPAKHETKTAIKSPTYHAMKIEGTQTGYRIHFLLDL